MDSQPHDRSERRIQPADPIARRRALAWTAAFTLAGAVAVASTLSWLDGLKHVAATDPRRAAGELAAAVRWFVWPAFLPLIAFALYGLRLARRIKLSRRYPPPGVPVTRDTAIVSGAAAVRRARWLTLLMVLLIGAGLLLPVLVLRAVDQLAHLTASEPND